MGVTVFALYQRINESFYLARQLQSFESGPVYVADPTTAVTIMIAHVLILLGSLYFGFTSVRKRKHA